MNETWKVFVTALLGSWPSQVSSWGKEAIAAYVQDLAARGVTPESALVAVRSCDGTQRFPPSAPELAALARQDPDRPTFDEAYQQLYGPGGVFGVRRAGVTVSEWVTAFAADYGHERLRMLEVDDPDWGHQRRRELRASWEQFVETVESRDLAQVARGRSSRRGLGRPDFAGSVGVGRRQIEQSSPAGEASK